MPSPFPGMDPYLEDPGVWPDFHNALAGEIRSALNVVLPQPYYARLEFRPEVGIVDDERRTIVPDVSVQFTRLPPGAPGSTETSIAGPVAVAEPRVEPSTSVRVTVPGEPIRHLFVEIRDSRKGHALVTLIEIVSPSNKRPGKDRRAYRKKRREVLGSDANLIEIDLHSAGEPVVVASTINAAWRRPGRADRYVVCVSRAWERGSEDDFPEYEIYPFGLPDSLPCILVPLRQGEAEVPLDLQYAFRRAYDTGPYLRGAVDYDEAPPVRLSDDERSWVRERVAAFVSQSSSGAPEPRP